MGIGLAEKFGDKPEHTVAQKKHRRNLACGPRLTGIEPQHHKQQEPFQQELVGLRRVSGQITRATKHHAPGQRRVGHTAPEFAVDEIAQAAGRQSRGHTWRHKVHDLHERPLPAARVPDHGQHHAQQTAVKAHATLPDGKDLQRVRQVISRLVKQAVAHAPTQHHAHDAKKQDVFHIAPHPGSGLLYGGKRQMPQAGIGQQHEEAKSGEVGQPVPMNGHGPELQRDRVNLRMDQHGLRLCTQAPPDDPSGTGLPARTAG